MKRIIHLDMDCFYAAVEEREDPRLRGHPVGVGGTGRRSVLATCNYRARRFGVSSAMPVYLAKRACPDLIIVPPRFELYESEARAIRAIFLRYTDRIEPLSLDEAYLDVSDCAGTATGIARKIRQEIRLERRLTASAGIAPNKMLAKIAGEIRKPDGQFTLLPSRVGQFMQELPVQRIWGVGPQMAERLKKLGITTCGQLQGLSPAEMACLFGRFGGELYHLCRGEDRRLVESDRVRKSLSTETTFPHDLTDEASCREALVSLVDDLRLSLRQEAPGRRIDKVFVKLKFSDFQQTTAEKPASELKWIHIQELLTTAWARGRRPVRLLGVGVRLGDPGHEQLELPLASR